MTIPVQRAESYYLPPPHLPPDSWQLTPPALRVVRWWEERNQRRMQPPPDSFVIGTVMWARIDAGRWVADCPCGSAQVVTPADPRMWCVECGAGWFRLEFPADVAAAEQEVADKPPHDRFWWHADDVTSWNRPAEPKPKPEPETEV